MVFSVSLRRRRRNPLTTTTCSRVLSLGFHAGITIAALHLPSLPFLSYITVTDFFLMQVGAG
jgi:hypothetical protein